MAETQIYGFPLDKFGDPPGSSLYGGVSGTGTKLAQAVEDELNRIETATIAGLEARIAALEAIVQPSTGIEIFTPSVIGGGSATFSTQTGRWRRISTELVWFIVYLVCDNPGSGSDDIQIGNMPVPINRATRQVIQVDLTAVPTPTLRTGHLMSFTSGATLDQWDRVRIQRGDDQAGLRNMVGSDWDTDVILTAQGVYQEETA